MELAFSFWDVPRCRVLIRGLRPGLRNAPGFRSFQPLTARLTGVPAERGADYGIPAGVRRASGRGAAADSPWLDEPPCFAYPKTMPQVLSAPGE
jgi:hypothetical protein